MKKTSSYFSRNKIKNFIGSLFYKTYMASLTTSNSLTVFAFHDISDQPSKFTEEHGLCISLNTFRWQCQWIALHFNVIHPTELVSGRVLPRNAAIISFDDGFRGSFENGLTILEELNLPSILFLNMASEVNNTPQKSAVDCYLYKSDPAFSVYAKRIGLQLPFHLTLNQGILDQFQAEFGPINLDLAAQYQGYFADLNIVEKWDLNPLVSYGNHLYEHWNAVALSKDEFVEQYRKNDIALKKLRGSMDLFAFTNGQPHTCYTNEHITILKALGPSKVFSCFSGVNRNYKDDFLLGRISLGPDDNSSERLWFRVARALTQVSRGL
jgi:peptidoglycan/xylan/chitin deacetylase (PgdA/CDA1 family)